ncbi:hypothetical protein Patl1_34878 [Pistacia atlantica]|uniref:Uncharacterized protein n=1 Tax=Pistacia atlantica TaxID=434234 RepID=A0ACC0ZQX5_9ROSI|nr:hypothetical protein Patl1_34878 [Pistacia atlantica]
MFMRIMGYLSSCG